MELLYFLFRITVLLFIFIIKLKEKTNYVAKNIIRFNYQIMIIMNGYFIEASEYSVRNWSNEFSPVISQTYSYDIAKDEVLLRNLKPIISYINLMKKKKFTFFICKCNSNFNPDWSNFPPIKDVEKKRNNQKRLDYSLRFHPNSTSAFLTFFQTLGISTCFGNPMQTQKEKIYKFYPPLESLGKVYYPIKQGNKIIYDIDKIIANSLFVFCYQISDGILIYDIPRLKIGLSWKRRFLPKKIDLSEIFKKENKKIYYKFGGLINDNNNEYDGFCMNWITTKTFESLITRKHNKHYRLTKNELREIYFEEHKN
ncbi:hypothetical protein SLOPH_761 [Spraguea lophii 42_110]|uniref:Uncharacterized protein n=1 Tax=Spraguea lophii (strain 42_110) TaxID=1358809 RepID=S7W9H7_SPRLO|nr:hypothetical protein SLOPH_761 [Spraguea lophii 42_110]